MHQKLCVLPWVHMHPFPDGNVSLCCFADHYPVGNLKNKTIADIANSPAMNEIRRQFLTGEHGPEVKEACKECWLKEDIGSISGRVWFNGLYGDDRIKEIIKDTNPDGSLTTRFKFRNMSNRVSNLCNYSCRSCSDERSSVIAQERGHIKFVKSILDVQPNYMNDLLPYMADIETAVFLGGESILIEEHDAMLEEIIRLGRQDEVKIVYFCNMSKLQHKGRSLVEYAKIFKNFTVNASIDAMGKRLELLRNGSNWDTVLTNLNILRDNNVSIKIWITVGNINAHHVPDLFQFMLDNKFIVGNNFEVSTLNEPRWMNPKVMPQVLKDEITERYKTFIKHIRDNDYNVDKKMLEQRFDNFIQFMNTGPMPEPTDGFVYKNRHYDSLRNQDLYDTYPELLPFEESLNEH